MRQGFLLDTIVREWLSEELILELHEAREKTLLLRDAHFWYGKEKV